MAIFPHFSSVSFHQTKNLSVNNVYVHFDLSERHNRRRQVVERQKAAFKLLISHQ
jgi:hypothetical protein